MAIGQIHTYCAMCVSRCGVIATVEDGRLTKVNADPEHPNGCICVKGTAAPEIVYSSDRLQYPMRRTRPKGDPDPGWTRISWDEALELTASRLLDVKAKYGAESVVFGAGTPAGGSVSDFEPWLHRLAHAFGSPNVMTNAHVCIWNRIFGSQYTYGVSAPRPDYDHTRCMLLWGFNPHASWPAAAARITRAKARGARLIVIDPRKSSLVEKADLWLRVRPGSDGVLALSMIHVLLEEHLYDDTFAHEWTNGTFLIRGDTHRPLTAQDLSPTGDPDTYVVWDRRRDAPVNSHIEHSHARDKVEASLTGTFSCTLADGTEVECRPAFQLLEDLAAQHAPERSEDTTWVPADDVRRAVRMFATEKPSCFFTWLGLEQLANAMQTNRAVNLFYALTGQFDTQGSNVFFASTPANPVTGQNLLAKEQASRRLGLAERPLGPPALPGFVQSYQVYRAILTAQPYPVKAMVLFGSDPLLGHADPLQGKAALEALDFYVHVDMVANPTASFADLLLPAATCWEREALSPSFLTAGDTATWAQLRPPVVQPLHASRPDLEIIFDLAQRLDLGGHFFDGDIEAAFNEQLAPSGLTAQQLRACPRGVRYAGQTRYQKYAEIDAATGQPHGFRTPTRKIEIYSTTFAKAGYDPLPVCQAPAGRDASNADADRDYPLALTFYRLVQFCDDQYRNIARLRRQVREPFLDIHPDTAMALDIQDGEWVSLETGTGKIKMKATYNAALHPRVVATQYGWWQECQALELPGYDPFEPHGANANLLVPNDVIDPISGSIPHRSQRCRVSKAVTSP